MFDHGKSSKSSGVLSGIHGALLAFAPGDDASVLVDELRALEDLRGALASAQARVTAKLVAVRRAEQARRGVPAERVGRGIAAEVGLARRMSPFNAARYIGQVGVLTRELPETFARLTGGEVPEWRALLVARETAWLSAEDRAAVDRLIAPELGRLGNRRTVDLVKKLSYERDPHGYLNRLKQAESDRAVSLRPGPDCMTRLTALLPLKQGVAAYAALKAAADGKVGVEYETRSRGQVMADTLVERITGQSSADAVPIEVNLVMTDQALLSSGDGSNEPAQLIGGGVIPAGLARRMLLDASGETQVFVRRLYLDPLGQLAATESRSRLFTTTQRRFLLIRDQLCRTPWCDAPIRHADHVVAAEAGGPTSMHNGQGLCEACNYAKQAPGWRQYLDGDDIVTVTPTRHTYRSRPPDLPGRDAVRQLASASPTRVAAVPSSTRAPKTSPVTPPRSRVACTRNAQASRRATA